MAKKIEEVRDGFLGDLPEELRIKVMAIHKIIVDKTRAEFRMPKYDKINKQGWAKSWLEEFLAEPTDKNHIGSVRVYRKGKRFRCMIQISGHVTNNRNTDDEELFHGMIRNVFVSIRSQVRRKFDCTITCESEHGEPFEGYDIWTKQKTAAQVWECFEGKKIKKISEYNESMIISDQELDSYMAEASHGKLKYDFRRAVDVNTGHALKVVYSLDDIKVDSIGSGTENIDSLENRVNYVQKNIRRKGNQDHQSHGQKVLAIIDRVTGKKLDHATVIGIYGASVAADLLDQGEDFVNYIKSKDEAWKNAHLSKIKVGEIDNVSLYKSTFWPKRDTEVKFKTRSGGSVKLTNDAVGSKNSPAESLLSGRGYKLNRIKPNAIFTGPRDVEYESGNTVIVCGPEDLPEGLQRTIFETASDLFGNIDDLCGFTEIRTSNGFSEGTIFLGEGFDAERLKRDDTRDKFKKNDDDPWDVMRDLLKSTSPEVLRDRMKERKRGKYFTNYQEDFELFNPGKFLEYDEETNSISIELEESYCGKLVDFLENRDQPVVLDVEYTEAKEHVSRVGNESFKLVPTDDGKQYDVYDRSGKEIGTIDAANSHSELEELVKDAGIVTESVESTSKLASIAQKIMGDKDKLSQGTINILATIISKDYLKQWAPGYSELKIKLKAANNNIVEFKIPKLTQDFVSRFIEGRETMQGLLHRDQVITMYISKDVFGTMENPKDLAKFFKNALKYYSSDVNRYIDRLMASVMRLDKPTKHIIATTKLSAIVVCPIQQVFIFDKVSMSGKNSFAVTKDQISAMNNFVKGITTRYSAPEKEKKEILDGLNKVIQSFREASEDMQFGGIVGAVSTYYEGGFNTEIDRAKESFYIEQYDMKWLVESKDPDIKYYQEKFGVKKLKKIPRDLVAYITIETEAIRDANDKMMIASYCLSKLEIVEWYIELLDVGSKKYIVPHTKPYLESVRTQLLACYKKIMDTPVPKKTSRPIIDVNYPE